MKATNNDELINCITTCEQKQLDNFMIEVYSNLGLIKLKKEKIREFEMLVSNAFDNNLEEIFKKYNVPEPLMSNLKQLFQNSYDLGEISGLLFAAEQTF
ncbi:hypothetical protein RFI02_16810 [Acinetobacter sichuanensis]|uniref:hypothetical protein n=1 Tax=Acinetobacter sichuanensis TaxID=2136183 RepID=UPI0028108AE2|nr:hypothetical protein [Acinetobacter sichuanensis]MDQ9022768.1 hypothetical protein [Acinetobacter sichuanensis]